MPNLLTAMITTAVTAALSPVLQSRDGSVPRDVVIQGNFTWGSGGTTADAWVQTSVDGGATCLQLPLHHVLGTAAL